MGVVAGLLRCAGVAGRALLGVLTFVRMTGVGSPAEAGVQLVRSV